MKLSHVDSKTHHQNFLKENLMNWEDIVIKLLYCTWRTIVVFEVDFDYFNMYIRSNP